MRNDICPFCGQEMKEYGSLPALKFWSYCPNCRAESTLTFRPYESPGEMCIEYKQHEHRIGNQRSKSR